MHRTSSGIVSRDRKLGSWLVRLASANTVGVVDSCWDIVETDVHKPEDLVILSSYRFGVSVDLVHR